MFSETWCFCAQEQEKALFVANTMGERKPSGDYNILWEIFWMTSCVDCGGAVRYKAAKNFETE